MRDDEKILIPRRLLDALQKALSAWQATTGDGEQIALGIAAMDLAEYAKQESTSPKGSVEGEWSVDAPTEPGFYWRRKDEGDEDVCRLERRFDGEIAYSSGLHFQNRVEYGDFEWWSIPLSPPGEQGRGVGWPTPSFDMEAAKSEPSVLAFHEGRREWESVTWLYRQEAWMRFKDALCDGPYLAWLPMPDAPAAPLHEDEEAGS